MWGGQGRLLACAPGRGGQEGETQTPKGARKNRTGRRVAIPEELGRRHRVVGWQKLFIKLMHFHTAPAAPTTPPTNRSPPTQTVSTRIRTRTKTAASNVAPRHSTTTRPATNGHPAAIPHSTTTSRHKIARTCTPNARRSTGIDNSKCPRFLRTKTPPPPPVS
jgi:hypothetical protein